MTDIAYWDQSYREAIEDVDRILAEMEGLDTEEASQVRDDPSPPPAAPPSRTATSSLVDNAFELERVHQRWCCTPDWTASVVPHLTPPPRSPSPRPPPTETQSSQN